MPTLRRVACILAALSLGRGAVPVEPPVEGWRSVYDGPGASADAILAVTTDAAGRPIVAVSSSIEGQGCSGTIRKSGLDGTALWEAEEQNFRPRALAVGPGESVVVAGEMQVEVQVGSTLRPAVVKYGPDGERLWRRDLLKFTIVCGVAVDAAGAVFVPVGATVEKLGPDGSTIWAAARDGFQPLRFAPLDGGLVLAGYEQGAGIQRWRTVRFGPGGEEDWSIPFGPADKDGAFIIAVAVAAGDRIALATIVASDGLVFEHVLAFYDLAGNLEARTTYPQYPSALIADGPGDIYLAGWGRKAGRADDDGILRMFPGEGPSFLRGDCDGDGMVRGNVTDAVVLLLYAFADGGEPPCLAACDVDGDAQAPGVTDAIWLLRFSFLGEAAPAPPFPECGTDPSTPLTCADSASCR